MKKNATLARRRHALAVPLPKLTLAAALLAGAWLGGCSGSATKEKNAETGGAAGQTATVPDQGWEAYGKDQTNQRYSTLGQITAGNVGDLKLAWQFDLKNSEAQECSPIIVDGVMYVSTAQGPRYVYALDARTGEKKWEHSFTVPDDVARFACCGIVSRGVAYHDGKVFVGRLDGKLTALDAKTGNELWTTEVVDYKQGSVITSPALVVDDKVVVGFGAGEYGGRSYISAYHVSDGKQVWKTYTVPGDTDEKVRKSWKGQSWKTGGAAAWYVGSYDPELKLIYWGTGNPSPWNAALRGKDSPDYGDQTNLYSTSTLALNPADGKIVWHYQHTPYDAWDYDGTNELVLASLSVNGQPTPVAMKADRNGYFYVLDRRTGKLVAAEHFVRANWADRIDLASGKPVENPDFRPTSRRTIGKGEAKPGVKPVANQAGATTGEKVYPSFIGGKNWQPMAFNPQTGLAYIPSNNMGMSFETSDVQYQRGYFYLGAEWEMEADGAPGEYVAWDPLKGQKAWSVPLKYPIPGGALTTAGNLVFFGDLDGNFRAFDAKAGKELWTYKTASGVGAAPVTFAAGGKQYVAVVAGRPTVIPGFIGGKLGEQMVKATPAGGTVYVFALP